MDVCICVYLCLFVYRKSTNQKFECNEQDKLHWFAANELTPPSDFAGDNNLLL